MRNLKGISHDAFSCVEENQTIALLSKRFTFYKQKTKNFADNTL